jgi:hypothetical protein
MLPPGETQLAEGLSLDAELSHRPALTATGTKFVYDRCGATGGCTFYFIPTGSISSKTKLDIIREYAAAYSSILAAEGHLGFIMFISKDLLGPECTFRRRARSSSSEVR